MVNIHPKFRQVDAAEEWNKVPWLTDISINEADYRLQSSSKELIVRQAPHPLFEEKGGSANAYFAGNAFNKKHGVIKHTYYLR